MATTARPLTPSGGTAKTLILIGLILQLIFALISVALLAAGFAAAAYYGVGAFGFGLAIYILGAAIGLVLLYLVYAFSYKRTREGNYQGARAMTIVWAILNIISIINILPGILYLIAYVKLGDAIREQQQMSQAPYGQPAYGQPMYAAPAAAAPMAGAPMPAPAPGAPAGAPAAAAPAAAAAAPAGGAAPVCPKCGQPATYVAQYGRWYCYRDQTYL